MKPGLRVFIERRLGSYKTVLANTDPGAESAFPDTAMSFAALKVREDTLRRLLADFDRAVAEGEYE
jgi:hypothetical protein